ncbi:MAG: ankyrin repeat domain-containing protein [Gemmatimonadaceae bacterium]|nr:ankyrin repeat domain-containing protein [Gemmatimonadaceae bacterium]
MSGIRVLPARPSLDSLRKQAKRLARDTVAESGDAIARVRAQVPHAVLPLSLRDAQLVIAREYGFSGWSYLMSEVEKRVGSELDWAASQARVAIHNDNNEQLRALLAKHPALIAWRDTDGQTLLDATTSYAMDCSDPERERTYTRPSAAELLLDAGATVESKTWMHVIRTGASGMLRLFAQKGALPQVLPVLAALGDATVVRLSQEAQEKPADIDHAFMIACRFRHEDIARQLLELAAARSPELGRRIDHWRSRAAFVEFLMNEPGILWQEPETTPWETFVVLQLGHARDGNDLSAFNLWLDNEPWLLERQHIETQARLILPACYQKDREAFIVAMLDRDAALLRADPPPRSSHIVQAMSYGNAHLIPLLTRIWPLPNDLPHAAGIGNAITVARWFDADGTPALGSLSQHYPHNDPQFPRTDLHWSPPSAQQVLDIALAWSVLNQHFDIAEFLLTRGANINTDWGTHEPASILHEAAIQGNEPAVRFLIQHGADLTMTDYRYRSTAEGWARYGANNERMADILAKSAQSGSEA